MAYCGSRCGTNEGNIETWELKHCPTLNQRSEPERGLHSSPSSSFLDEAKEVPLTIVEVVDSLSDQVQECGRQEAEDRFRVKAGQPKGLVNVRISHQWARPSSLKTLSTKRSGETMWSCFTNRMDEGKKQSVIHFYDRKFVIAG